MKGEAPNEGADGSEELIRLQPAARALGLHEGELRERMRTAGVQLLWTERGGERVPALRARDLERLAGASSVNALDAGRLREAALREDMLQKEQEIEELRRGRDGALAQSGRLESELIAARGSAQEQMQRHLNRIADLEADLAALRLAHAATGRELERANAEREQAQREGSETRAELERIRGELREGAAQSEQIRSELEEQRAARAKFEERYARSSDELGFSKKTLAERELELEREQKRAAELRSALEELDQERARIAQLGDDREKALAEELHGAQREASVRSQERERERARADELVAKIGRLEGLAHGEAARLQESEQAAKRQLEEQVARIAELESTLAERDGALAASEQARSAREEADGRAAALSAALEEAREDTLALQTELDRNRAQMAERRSATERLAELQRRDEEREAEREQARRAEAGREMKTRELELRLAARQEELDAARAALAKSELVQREATERMAAMRLELQEQERPEPAQGSNDVQREQLEGELAAARESLDAARAEREVLAQRVLELDVVQVSLAAQLAQARGAEGAQRRAESALQDGESVLEALARERDELRGELAETREKLTAHGKVLAERDARLAQVGADVERANGQSAASVAELERLRALAQVERKGRMTTLESLKSERALGGTYKAQLGELNAACDQLRAQLERERKRAEQFERTAAANREALLDAERQVAQHDDERLRGRYREKEKQLAAANDESRRLIDTIEKWKREDATLREELLQARQAFVQLESASTEAQSRVTQLDEACQGYRNENRELRGVIEQLQSAPEPAHTTPKEHLERAAAVERKLHSVQEELAAARRGLAEGEHERRAVVAQLEELQSRLHATQRIEGELEQERVKQAELWRRMETLQAEAKQFYEQAQEANQELARLTQALDTQRRHGDEQRAEHERALSALQDKYLQAEGALRTSQHELKHGRGHSDVEPEKLQRFKAERDGWKERAEGLMKESDRAVVQITQLQTELNAVRKRCAELESRRLESEEPRH